MYYRYLRFFADGRCLCKISADRVGAVARLMRAPRPPPKADVFPGHAQFSGGPLSCELAVTVVYPGRHPTAVRSELRLRSP